MKLEGHPRKAASSWRRTPLLAAILGWAVWGLHPAASAQPRTVDQVAATVNGDVITLSDVRWLIQYRRIPLPDDVEARRGLYTDTLRQIIEQKLIAAEAVQTPGIQVSSEEVSGRVAAYRSQFPDEAAFRENLASMEMTVEDLRELVRRQLSVLKFVKLRFEPFIIVLPDQIQDYYERELLPEFEKGGREAPPRASVEEQIRQILTLEKTNDEVDRWVRGAIDKAKVEILLRREASISPNLPPGYAERTKIEPLKPPL